MDLGKSMNLAILMDNVIVGIYPISRLFRQLSEMINKNKKLDVEIYVLVMLQMYFFEHSRM